MRYLVNGSSRTVGCLARDYPDLLGILTAPGGGNSFRTMLKTGLAWALDNGAFSGFDASAFERRLFQCIGLPGCLFIVCPDVVGDATATLARFHEWRKRLYGLGHPIALVGQDGAEKLDLPWHLFDCWFIGGSTNWKLSQASYRLAQEAKKRGKYLHMGRVNSERRIEVVHSWGCNSVDGTSASKFAERWLPKWLKQIRLCEQQTKLFPGE